MQKRENNPQNTTVPPKAPEETSGALRIVPVVLTALAVYLIICFTLSGVGVVGSAVNQCLLGLFGGGAYILPFLLLVHALFFKTDIDRSRFISRLIFSGIALLATSTLIYTFRYFSAAQPTFDVVAFYANGKALAGGGVIGDFFGFVIRAAIGQAGVIIFFAAILAAYAVYFFSARDSASRRVLLFFLSKVAGFFAAIEKFFRTLFGKISVRANERREKAKQDRDNALFADDYFAVDNGLKTLSVSGIGITEERDDASLESHPVLRNTVHPVDPAVPKKPVRPIGNEYFSDYPLAEEPEEVRPEEPKAEADSRFGLDESADAFFAKDFDPFDLAIGEKLAATRSSQAAEIRPGIASFSDSIDTMTPERLEQAKRNAKFEESRRRAIEAAERSAAERAAIEAQNKEAADAVIAANLARSAADAEMQQKEETIVRESSEPVGINAPREDEPATEVHSAPIAESTTVSVPEETVQPIDTEEPIPVSEADDLSNGEIPASGEQAESSEEKEEIQTVPEDVAPIAAKKIDFTVKEPERFDGVPSSPFSSVIEKRYEADFAAFDLPSEASVANGSIVAEEAVPVAESAPVEETVTADEPAPVEETAPVAKPAPVEEAVPVAEPAPVEETVTADEPVPVEESAPVAEPAPVEEDISVAEPAPVEEAVPAEEPVPFTESAPITVETAEEPVFAPYITPTIEEPAPIEKPVEQIRTERAMINPDAGFPELTVSAEDVSELDEAEEPEEGEEALDEQTAEAASPKESESYYEEKEIPPAEQSELVRRLRAMYAPLREEDTESAEAVSDPENKSVPESEAVSDPIFEPSLNDQKGEDVPPFEPSVKQEIPTFRLPEKPSVSEAVNEEETVDTEPDYSDYEFPPIDLLAKAKPTNEDECRAELQETAENLIKTLESFHVSASIKGFDRGPRITRFEIVPAAGVRVQTILNLEPDITLALAAEGMRIESPIPGKSAMGFEIPNRVSTPVMLRDLIDTDEFRNAKSKTYVAVGKDVVGSPVYDDFANITHGLVAGATGMGKSVFINSLIVSVLYKARPNEVRFIMIDPKQVEFSKYAGIPHLLIPVVTDPKQAAGALTWAVDEMNRRYNIMREIGVKKIDDYNEKVSIVPEMGKPLPKILIFIDELNDIMSQSSLRDAIEFPILQIVQKARAAGIHLIIGTQRPDVKVITGTIKANIPTRASCKVMSLIDSRTILDSAGAEKLLGKGDMLYHGNGKPRPIRIQGAFVSDDEVEKVMNFLRAQCSGDSYDQKVLADINAAAKKCDKSKDEAADDADEGGEGGGCLFSDQKFLDAVDVAISSGKISTSLLQRKIGIGYGKAAKYIDFMENQGIVGERDGMKPRDVKITRDEWFELLSRREIDD